MNLITKFQPKPGVIVEYDLIFDRNETQDACEWPNNEIRLKLYHMRGIAENNIAYYDAGVGFTKDGIAGDLNYDYCTNKIVIGVDKRFLNNDVYITNLINWLLKEQYFTKSKIDLLNGTYTFSPNSISKGKKVLAGNYVGELVVNKDGYFQKTFDEQYGKDVYEELIPQIWNRQKIEKFNTAKAQLKEEYIKKMERLQEEYNKSVRILAKRYGITDTVYIENLAYLLRGINK